MDVRGAVDADAEAPAAVIGAPIRAMRRLVRDRTVYLVTAETSSDPHADALAGDEPVFGFVDFDVRDGILYVTRLGGTETAVRRLFEKPLRFASTEDLSAEVLILESEAPLCEVVEHAGFDRVGHGPRFGGSPALRYVLDETG